MRRIRLKGLRRAVILWLIWILPARFFIHAQSDYPYDIHHYDFIQYDKNKLIFPGDSGDFERVFNKMDTLILLGQGKITIVQIGGSHIQADVYPGRLRLRLQTFYPGMNGGRGFVFPYKMAQTNSPRGYKISYSGIWSTCRNVELKKNCNLGLSGITAITHDSLSTLNLFLTPGEENHYLFNRIKLFYSTGKSSFVPELDSVDIDSVVIDREMGYSTFYLKHSYDKFGLKLRKTDSLQNYFELYGISLENDDPGFVYHSIGINGASFPSFLRCNLLEKQLKVLKPDMVILSLGTNDAYTTHFKPEFYESNYKEMIGIIRRAAPEAAILNTVANDSYLFRRYPNKNTQLAENVIYDVAKNENCGVWDFYEVMGGFNSSKLWQKQNLMGRDLIHFNLEGYLLVGDLFFNAIIKSYDNHIIHRDKP